MRGKEMREPISVIIERINKRDAERIVRINAELDSVKMAYRVKDVDGNTFAYGGLEDGFPWYRSVGGSKHIYGMTGYEVIQQYAV
jgi:hypothetical protein